MTKVMKYELTYLDGCGDFREMQKTMWGISNDVRTVLNRTIQMWANWDFESRKHFEETGAYLDCLKEIGQKQFRGHVYDTLKDQHEVMGSRVLISTINKADKKYKSCKREVLSGEMSLPSYKRDQPIPVPKSAVKLETADGKPTVTLSVIRQKTKKERGWEGNLRFSVKLGDGTQKSIFNRTLNGEYKLGECQLVYDRPKWFLMLTYSFEPKQEELDPDRVLGVDLGQAYAVYASSFGNRGVFKIEGGEVEEYARRQEAKIRSMQNQARHCGDGRVGHGTKTRVAPIYKSRNKIENYRKTINDLYSRELVDYAAKNRYGVIQMEDLSGIKEDTGFPRRLRHWTYYDLQTKVENKCREAGIVFRKVPAQYTSQRCSRCGFIDRDNRKTQAEFRCVSCGFGANADYNASQNISIPDIGEIIKETIGANRKQS
jgi:IS605 OrfB family transposase